jgi:hypothetical protein
MQQGSASHISPELVRLIRQICPLESPEHLQQQPRSAANDRRPVHGATTAADASQDQAVQRGANSRNARSPAVKVKAIVQRFS